MPNIEIFGFNKKDQEFFEILRIAQRNLDVGELEELVFTYHNTTVLDINGKKSPFVRITDDDEKRAQKIAEFYSRYIDVEIMILKGFISCKKIIEAN